MLVDSVSYERERRIVPFIHAKVFMNFYMDFLSNCLFWEFLIDLFEINNFDRVFFS